MEGPRTGPGVRGAEGACHLVFLPDRAAPRFLVWGAGAVASPLSAGGTPENAAAACRASTAAKTDQRGDAIAFLAASGTDGATSHHRGLARASRVESRHRDASGAGEGGAANRARGEGGRGRVPSRVSSRPRGAALPRVGRGRGRVAALRWRHAGERS